MYTMYEFRLKKQNKIQSRIKSFVCLLCMVSLKRRSRCLTLVANIRSRNNLCAAPIKYPCTTCASEEEVNMREGEKKR